MKLEIANKIRVYSPPEILKERWIRQLKIKNPEYVEAQMAGRSTWDVPEFIYNFVTTPDGGLLVPRGIRHQLLEDAEREGVKVDLIDNRTLFPYIEVDIDTIKYRPYQFDSVMKLVTVPEGVLVSPAGSGKTVVGLSLIPITGQPTLWLTHTGPLAKQAITRAEEFLPNIGKIGFIGSGKWVKGEILTVAMVQTLIRNIDKTVEMQNDFGLVVLDEAHHCPASTFLNVVSRFNPFFLYGLTATPYRRDKLEILMFQTLGQNKTIINVGDVGEQMIVPKIKVRPVYHDHVAYPDDLQYIIKHYVVENKARNATIVADVLKEAEMGKSCLVVSDRKVHCENLYDLLKKKWKKTGIVTGDYKKSHIDEEIRKTNEKETTILVATYSLFGEGTDIPVLERAFVAMPFRSKAKVVQLVGRVQRSAAGKKDAIVYDYVDVGVGILENQFHNSDILKESRMRGYESIGAEIEKCNN